MALTHMQLAPKWNSGLTFLLKLQAPHVQLELGKQSPKSLWVPENISRIPMTFLDSSHFFIPLGRVASICFTDATIRGHMSPGVS